MEEIISAFFRGLVQGTGYFIGEILCKYLFQYTGAGVIKVLSLGSYPKVLDEEGFDSISGIYMTMLGAAVWIGVVVYLIVNYG